MEKPYFCEGSDAMVALEGMVDTVGLSNVIYALAHICSEKAEHLRCNWQDKETARAWEMQANQLNKIAPRL